VLTRAVGVPPWALRPKARPPTRFLYPVPRPAEPIPESTTVERLILALRSDFGCLCIAVAFLAIMISTIVFADIITPSPSSPLL